MIKLPRTSGVRWNRWRKWAWVSQSYSGLGTAEFETAIQSNLLQHCEHTPSCFGLSRILIIQIFCLEEIYRTIHPAQDWQCPSKYIQPCIHFCVFIIGISSSVWGMLPSDFWCRRGPYKRVTMLVAPAPAIIPTTLANPCLLVIWTCSN